MLPEVAVRHTEQSAAAPRTIAVAIPPPLNWAAPRIPMAGPVKSSSALQFRAGHPGAHPFAATVDWLGGPEHTRNEGREDPEIIDPVVVARLFRDRVHHQEEPAVFDGFVRVGQQAVVGFLVGDVQAFKNLCDPEVAQEVNESPERPLVVGVSPPADGDGDDQRAHEASRHQDWPRRSLEPGDVKAQVVDNTPISE